MLRRIYQTRKKKLFKIKNFLHFITFVFVIFHILFLQRFHYTPIFRHCQPFFGIFIKFSKIFYIIGNCSNQPREIHSTNRTPKAFCAPPTFFYFYPIDFGNEKNRRRQALNRPSEERIFRFVSNASRLRFAIEPDIPPRHREAPDKEPRVFPHAPRAR